MTQQNHQEPLKVEFLLSRQGDGDLTAEETEALGRLLREETHRETAHRYERLDALLKRLSGQEPAVDWDRFGARVQRRIDPARRHRVVLSRRVRILAPLAAAASVAVVASLYWSGLQPGQQLEQSAAVAVAEPVMQIAYRHPVDTWHRQGRERERISAVKFSRTPPSPDWKPVYEGLIPHAAVAMCGPDPVRGSSAVCGGPVF